MASMTVQQAFDLARQHHQARRLREAETLYRQVLQQEPGHRGALQMLARLAYEVGQYAAATELLGRAIEVEPNSADLHGNLGMVLASANRLDEAIARFRHALSLRPDSPELHNNLANALHASGEPGPAVEHYRRAVALRPAYLDAWMNLGAALQRLGRNDEAVAALHEAMGLGPADAPTFSDIAMVLRDAGQYDEAIAAYRRAATMAPDWPEVHSGLASALRDVADVDGAIACLRRALSLKQSPQAGSGLLLTMHFHPYVDARQLAQEHAQWNKRHARPLSIAVRPHADDRAPAPDRRLRVGYVSQEFNGQPVGRFILPLLEHHDRQAIEVVCYADVEKPDATTARLRPHADAWHDVHALTDEQLADRVREDRIDILVDLAKHTYPNRMLCFARRPAPVQVTYMPYASTTGVSQIDYRLSDPYLDPPDGDVSGYAERTMRLPHTYWCYPPPDVAPEVGPLPGAAGGGIRFGCLNNFAKVNSAVLGLWARVLSEAPGSQLTVHAPKGSHRDRAHERLAASRVDPQRLQFVEHVPTEAYFAQYNQIDIALDPFPFPGGTTTCDALWMGVPVVSLAGQTAVSRGGLSILSNVGLAELAAASADQYVQIARDLAADLPRLAGLRSTLRERMRASPLMDAPQFARDVENAFRIMWQNWCATFTATR